MAEPEQRTAVFVWGSCVSRDSLEFFPQADIRNYVARHSAISASSDASALHLPPLASPFQQRMSAWDVTGRAPRLLGDVALDLDLVLFDLCDERLGVYEVAPGVFVTRSVERIADGTDARLARDHRHIPFGSDEHFALWSAAIAQVMLKLRLLRRSHLLRVVAPPWAGRDDLGAPTAPSAGMTAAQANQAMARYLDVFRADGVHIVGEGIDAVSDHQHRWGPAPFHYTADTYRALVAELAADLPPRPPRP